MRSVDVCNAVRAIVELARERGVSDNDIAAALHRVLAEHYDAMETLPDTPTPAPLVPPPD